MAWRTRLGTHRLLACPCASHTFLCICSFSGIYDAPHTCLYSLWLCWSVYSCLYQWPMCFKIGCFSMPHTMMWLVLAARMEYVCCIFPIHYTIFGRRCKLAYEPVVIRHNTALLLRLCFMLALGCNPEQWFRARAVWVSSRPRHWYYGQARAEVYTRSSTPKHQFMLTSFCSPE